MMPIGYLAQKLETMIDHEQITHTLTRKHIDADTLGPRSTVRNIHKFQSKLIEIDVDTLHSPTHTYTHTHIHCMYVCVSK